MSADTVEAAHPHASPRLDSPAALLEGHSGWDSIPITRPRADISEGFQLFVYQFSAIFIKIFIFISTNGDNQF